MKFIQRICLIFSLLLGFSYGQPQNLQKISLPDTVFDCEKEAPWTLVFHDEFEGTELDREKWYTYYPVDARPPYDSCSYCRTHDKDRKGNSGVGENQVFLDKNVRLTNGELVLVGKKRRTRWMGEEYSYRSGMIHGKRHWSTPRNPSYPTPDFLYGKFEIRCSLPEPEWWPAFWLIGRCNDEIDVFEVFWHQDSAYKFNLRTNREANGERDTCRRGYRTVDGYRKDLSVKVKAPTIREGYHTFGVEWSPYEFEFFYDGQSVGKHYRFYKSEDTTAIPCGARIEAGEYFDNLTFVRERMTPIANFGVADRGDKEKARNDNMIVDYIRVWQKSPEPKFTDCGERVLSGSVHIPVGGKEAFSMGGGNLRVEWEVDASLRIDSTYSEPGGASQIWVSPKSASARGYATITARSWSKFCAYKEEKRMVWVGKP